MKEKEIVKEHPLRPIILQFDLQKTPLDFEIKALNAYYRMHDKTWEVKQDFTQHKNTLQELEIKTIELEYRLLPIQQQLDLFEAAFRLTDNIELPMIEDEISIEVGEFNRDVINHSKELILLNKEVRSEEEWYNYWADLIYEEEDWFDQEDDEGDTLIHKVFSHYNEVSVNIVSLDRDQQEFFGTIAEVKKLQNEYFDSGTLLFEKYTDVHYLSESIYRRAERVNDFIDNDIKRRGL